MQNNPSDDSVSHQWYHFAAKQNGFVGIWLQLLRERNRITSEQQRKEFQASNEDFIRLQGMPLPRPNQFTKDARQIAEICHVNNVSAFVQALLLARSLVRAQLTSRDQPDRLAAQLPEWRAYQAAYDAEEDLDEPPDQE